MVDISHDFIHGSFGGVTCAQFLVDFYLWEAVLNENPEIQGIIELGTWEGGFALYLNAQATARGIHFRTFDIIKPEREIPNFVQLDIYRYPEKVAEWADFVAAPIALFCDGGNKPRELLTFPQLMPPGSIFLVHDWGTEIDSINVSEDLEMIYGPWCEEIGSITRVFRWKEDVPLESGATGERVPVGVGG